MLKKNIKKRLKIYRNIRTPSSFQITPPYDTSQPTLAWVQLMEQVALKSNIKIKNKKTNGEGKIYTFYYLW
jgi:hypothetical protein